MTAPQTKSKSTAAPTGDHIVFIDYIRAVAILLVVGFHLLIESYGGLQKMESQLSFTDGNWHHFLLKLLPFSYGFIGVSIFFFVSGFCIHLSHEKSKLKGYKVFFVRRFFRIYPPYFVALCFFAFLFPLTRLALNSPINLAQFFSHVLMVHNLDGRSFYGINGTFWTLGVEVQLYLIYPLLLWLVRRFGWNNALLVTGVIEISLRGMGNFVSWPYWVAADPFFFWFSWSIGARLADDYLQGRPILLARSPVGFWLCVAALSYTVKPLYFLLFPSVSLVTAAAVAHLVSRPAGIAPSPRFVWQWQALRQIGVVSYSVYLLHGPLLAYVAKALPEAFPAHAFSPFAISNCLLLFCVLLFLISWLFYRWVELPGIELGKWVLKRMVPLPAPVPAAANERSGK